jgi:two-component system, NarL family, sensor histidine kinase DesK
MDSRLDSRPATGANQALENRRSTFLLWLVWILWIPFFTPQIRDLLQSHQAPLRLALSLVGAIVFFTLYLWVSWQSARSLTSHAMRVFPTGLALWAPVAGLFALGAGLTTLNGNSWGTIFFYVSSGAAGWLPAKQAIPVIAGLVLFIAAAFAIQGNLADAESPVVFIGTVGAIVIAFTWSVGNGQQLRLAREEMARAAAVGEERLRIARDLHDLLGHNLSLIALKSELAQRLIAIAPERATTEIGDIERVARTALSEVREAVASYRQPTLARALQDAREMLAAAGIGHRIEDEQETAHALPSAAEGALSWAVREGVTNVIRHSGARQCAIRLMREPAGVCIAISDDGAGSAVATGSEASGNGLRGLAERVEALGGRVEAGSQGNTGFLLSVWVPTPSLPGAKMEGANGDTDGTREEREEPTHAITHYEGDAAR